MGIVNVTPDSFSDGGSFFAPEAAIEHGCRLATEGAEILDVGGESTRPGAGPVGAEEELRRVVPVIEGIAASEWGGSPPQISIDTSKASVASAALAAGASLVNDVSALRGDPEMAGVVAGAGADCCLMHMLGEPRTMQRDPRYSDVVDEVKAFLEERLAFAVREGVEERRILLDPGIGFGKTVEHNLELLRRLDELVGLGRPVLVGTSRKSFLGRLAGESPAATPGARGAVSELSQARVGGTIATNVLALARGASVFRVHEVAPLREALIVAAATLAEGWTASGATKTQTTS